MQNGTERVKAITLQSPRPPMVQAEGHLGTNHRELVSSGQENGEVSRLFGCKGAAYIYLCVYKNPPKHDSWQSY